MESITKPRGRPRKLTDEERKANRREAQRKYKSRMTILLREARERKKMEEKNG